MTKLTDSQLVTLTAAAARDNGRVLPLPQRLKAKGAARTSILKGLIAKGLIEECRASLEDEIWRAGNTEERLTLRITDAGLEAIGIDAPETESAEGGPRGIRDRNPVVPLVTAKRRSNWLRRVAVLTQNNSS